MTSDLVLGFDLSLAHGACVLLLAGKVEAVAAYATQPKDCKLARVAPRIVVLPASSGHRREPACMVSRLPRSIAKMPREQRALIRLQWIDGWVWVQTSVAITIGGPESPIVIALEDYAYDAGHGAHQLGELGGVVKLALLGLLGPRLRLRLIDPTTAKMGATNNGRAEKADMLAAVPADVRVDLGLARLSDVVSEDVVDAYHLARLAHLEVQVRAGRVSLDQLTEGERRMFLRVTKANPVNLLDRPYVAAAEWGDDE